MAPMHRAVAAAAWLLACAGCAVTEGPGPVAQSDSAAAEAGPPTAGRADLGAPADDAGATDAAIADSTVVLESATADAASPPEDTPAPHGDGLVVELPPEDPVLDKPTACTVDKTTNFIQGIALDQLPPGYPWSTPVRPAVKPNTWANNGMWFNGAPSLAEGHAIQAFKGHVYVADSDGGQILDYDGDLKLLRNIPLAKPRQLSVDLSGALYVLHGAGSLSVVGPTAQTTTLQLDLGVPAACMLIWKNQYVVIGNSATGEVAAYGLLGGAKLWQAQTYGQPTSLASDGDRVVVALQTGEPRQIALPKDWLAGKGEALVLPTTPLPLRGKNPWHTYDTQTGTIHPDWPSSHGFAATSDGKRVLVAHSLAVTGGSETVLEAKKLGIDPSLVVVTKPVVYYGFSLADPCKSAPIRPLEVAVSAFSGGGAEPTQSSLLVRDPQSDRNLLALFDQPIDVRTHPTRTLALVAARGTDNVLVLNTRAKDPMQVPIAVLHAGQGPVGVAVAEGMPFAYTLDIDSRTVTRIPLQALLAQVDVGAQVTPMPAPLHLKADLKADLPEPVVLPNENWRIGRRLFHAANNGAMAAAGRQACASCHIAGRDDKLVWATKEGMRQTVSLAGRLQGTAPYGWSGDFATLDAKIDQGVEHMGGKGLTPQQRTQLMVYLLSLALPPKAWASPPVWQYLDGKALYESPSIGCAICHGGPTYSDGKAWDVGTANSLDKQLSGWADKIAFDTPSLLGVGNNAPHLHDGSAETLWDVVNHTEDKMGTTGQLNAQQIDALVAYLQTL